MANIEITNNKVRGVVLFEPVFKNETVTFADDGTMLEGTILARNTATLKLVEFVKGGTTNGNGIPTAVLTQELTAESAGDVPVKVMVSGQVRAGDLVIAADGDATNIDDTVLDELRDFGIIGLETTQLAQQDNQ